LCCSFDYSSSATASIERCEQSVRPTDASSWLHTRSVGEHNRYNCDDICWHSHVRNYIWSSIQFPHRICGRSHRTDPWLNEWSDLSQWSINARLFCVTNAQDNDINPFLKAENWLTIVLPETRDKSQMNRL
jgi:hypothetical protein